MTDSYYFLSNLIATLHQEYEYKVNIHKLQHIGLLHDSLINTLPCGQLELKEFLTGIYNTLT